MDPMIFEILGWTGAFIILLAYYLVSTKYIKSTAASYHFLNMLGSALVIFNVWYHMAIPAIILNSVWFLIALFSLVKMQRF
jgi:hypothetical protein